MLRLRRAHPVRTVLALPVAVAIAVPLTILPASAQDAEGLPGSDGSSASGSSGGSGSGVGGSVIDRVYPDPDNGPSSQQEPREITDQNLPGLPEGVSVDRVEWMSDRLVNVFINSAAMPGGPVKVQILLARDFHREPDKTFPSVWALDGLRTGMEDNGWLTLTDVQTFYADKNVNVVMPVGGPSSYYADWVNQPEDGVDYQWETFLTEEVPAVLEQGWRTNDRRAIVGLSMGGTAAANIAHRNPDLFDFMGSFSGYLDTTSPGMPQAIDFSIGEGAPGYSATDMWGPYYSQTWRDHDPKLNVGDFGDMTLYVSAGNGNAGSHDEEGAVPGYPEDPAAWGLEALARMTSQTFVNTAKTQGKDVITSFRPNGTHRWEYWDYEMRAAWPHMADSLGLEESDSEVDCKATGAFADAVERYNDENDYDLGECISEEYDGPDGGTIQEFQHGTLYRAKGEDDVVGAWGRTGGHYTELGGPESWLGYPVTPDTGAKDGGRWARFDNGYMYHVPDQGYVTVRNDIAEAWGKTDWEFGPLGYPVAEEKDVDGPDGDTGQWQKFQGGTFVRNPDGEVHYVRGYINERYRELGGPADSELGFPTGNQGETKILDGAYSDFEDGVIYWSEETGVSFMYRDGIYDRYAEEGFEGGDFGFLVKDVEEASDGSRTATFQNGTISMDADGKVTAELDDGSDAGNDESAD
jgi:S-formylglutathione hydrolase FrmB